MASTAIVPSASALAATSATSNIVKPFSSAPGYSLQSSRHGIFVEHQRLLPSPSPVLSVWSEVGWSRGTEWGTPSSFTFGRSLGDDDPQSSRPYFGDNVPYPFLVLSVCDEKLTAGHHHEVFLGHQESINWTCFKHAACRYLGK
ncbi:hypothetical protein N7448_001816 [Penicillium atrosanguineum]|uniref:Uncharacterized protein n=1 Tax=Penicillium atrosanguineum TaxID=1132637 RepID=A0A9W9LCE4_9EURO|nr:alcohol dehydrogenase [Penicillium atrosanguineum]KAJ5133154.1 hypothetical protein N7526_004519 [Penicillium atrosanguineum]KAJ5150238.1 hypothetical protein N7448_001816 [Penicillium atrosanguineum]KAJ5305554.1 alcohol dehydrogenase [Penicillium atrosanguineum]KAJ5325016.1 hypothetical protein N7476_003616 [Penicillium atrosanguineum]